MNKRSILLFTACFTAALAVSALAHAHDPGEHARREDRREDRREHGREREGHRGHGEHERNGNESNADGARKEHRSGPNRGTS